MLSYLHGDHPSATLRTSLRSTATTSNGAGTVTGNIQYTAYGRYRGGSKVLTENRFTSQKLDGSGFYYYNARYYDPQLGTFISPDTLVPDETSLFAYNRYMYSLGNPLKYSDPTGHYAICFQEGFATGQESKTDTTSAIYNLCTELAGQNLFGASGQYGVFSNNVNGQMSAMEFLAKMQEQYPGEDFTLIGYSWGGGAAFEFARSLDSFAARELGIENRIDQLVTIDPVVSGRWWAGRTASPAGVIFFARPFDNVETGLNLLASDKAYGFLTPFDLNVGISKPFYGNIHKQVMPDTNHCTVGFADCSNGGASWGSSHLDDNSGQPNPDTVGLIADFLKR